MKVYLSSTFSDLAEYREQVYGALRKIRQDVISMEDYAAGDQRPLDKCLQDVAEADVYVGLFAWRYGYVPRHGNPAGRSITELEFREADRLGKPCLIFLLRETAEWPIVETDFYTGEGGAGSAIKALREEFQDRYMIGFFETPQQAATEVMAAIHLAEFGAQAESDARVAGAVVVAPPKPQEAARAKPRDHFPNLWTPGDVVRIRFLDGEAALQERVAQTAAQWEEHANLHFEFGDDPNAEVRVSFAQQGTWSYPGTDCLNKKPAEPTMNYGWLETTTADWEIARTVLHEFGHVLGLLHEHQNPNRPPFWDEERTYQYYEGPPNYWTRSQVDEVVFRTWNPDLFPVPKPFDPSSIMVFPVPKELTVGDFEIGWNRQLSLGDKEFVAQLYPV